MNQGFLFKRKDRRNLFMVFLFILAGFQSTASALETRLSAQMFNEIVERLRVIVMGSETKSTGQGDTIFSSSSNFEPFHFKCGIFISLEDHNGDSSHSSFLRALWPGEDSSHALAKYFWSDSRGFHYFQRETGRQPYLIEMNSSVKESSLGQRELYFRRLAPLLTSSSQVDGFYISSDKNFSIIDGVVMSPFAILSQRGLRKVSFCLETKKNLRDPSFLESDFLATANDFFEEAIEAMQGVDIRGDVQVGKSSFQKKDEASQVVNIFQKASEDQEFVNWLQINRDSYFSSKALEVGSFLAISAALVFQMRTGVAIPIHSIAPLIRGAALNSCKSPENLETLAQTETMDHLSKEAKKCLDFISYYYRNQFIQSFSLRNQFPDS